LFPFILNFDSFPQYVQTATQFGPAPLPDGYIFLSHSSADKPAARQFAQALRRNGLEVWFDEDSFEPGDRWMATLEQAIQKASAMIVYVGRLGAQKWVDREVRFGLVRNTLDPAFRLIPVLSEGADPAQLPPFLLQQQCVDLRDQNRVPEKIQRLVETLRNGHAQKAIPDDYWADHSPFRSLQVFKPEDSWLFFGRDSETDDLVARLAREPVVAVLGNSGSGKSSLIRAGLIPTLRRGRFRKDGASTDSWQIAVFRPSQAPFDSLAETLPGQLMPELSRHEQMEFIADFRKKLPFAEDALRNGVSALASTQATTGKGRILLVADQFEEIFTLTSDRDTRERYINALLAASRPGGAVAVHLVLALRADFYSHCLEHPELSRRLEANLYNVPRMDAKQLRDTIEKRLALAAAHAETGLIDSLLADVGSEPGDLALLEHALDQVWEKRGPGNKLTNASYVEIGRLRGALGRHADEVYGEIGGETEKLLVQKIFLALVHVGEDALDTRQRVSKQELLQLGSRQEIEPLLDRLASSRLISTSGEGEGGQEHVEVAHESLIRNWDRLRSWLNQNREFLVWRDTLRKRARDWKPNEPASLLPEKTAIFQRAMQYLGERPDDLDDSDKAFIRASNQYAKRRRRSRYIAIIVMVATCLAGLFVWVQKSRKDTEIAEESNTDSYRHKLEADAPTLWPGLPDKIPDTDRWLGSSKHLQDEMPILKERLKHLGPKSDELRKGSLGRILQGLEAFTDLSSRVVELRNSEQIALNYEAAHPRQQTIDKILVDINKGRTGGPWPKPQNDRVRFLVPLGTDPDSNLQEFGHLLSGEIPKRDQNGKLLITERSSLVFVLIPGGSFTMGAQRNDSGAANFDHNAKEEERPLRRITLAPFLLCKYEMTKGQWLRMTGANPSEGSPMLQTSTRDSSFDYPVNTVSWNTFNAVLGPLGMDFPTEAQWEYSARGGSKSIQWNNETFKSFSRVANVRETGSLKPTRVGAYPPNKFGLYDMIGNVWEFCRDLSGPVQSISPLDGERLVLRSNEGRRTDRGGSYFDDDILARPTAHYEIDPDYKQFNLGIRPAINLFK
jgi:formylglycine-generating enzyme required for sulfatase activity